MNFFHKNVIAELKATTELENFVDVPTFAFQASEQRACLFNLEFN